MLSATLQAFIISTFNSSRSKYLQYCVTVFTVLFAWSHLLDGLKGVSFPEWDWLSSLVSSAVRGLPGSLWMVLSGGQTPLPDSGSLCNRKLLAWTGFPLGSRLSASSWLGPRAWRSFWEEDCTKISGMGRGEEEGSLWDNCSFFMWWITAAALKACCWKCKDKRGIFFNATNLWLDKSVAY